MKRAAEVEVVQCVDGSCVPMRSGTSGSGGNCSTDCVVFLECTAIALINKTDWQIGRKLYNKSEVASARDRCFSLPESRSCLNIHQPGIADPPISLDNPKRAGCLNLDCFYCGQTIYKKYFECALDCGKVRRTFPPFCRAPF